jgi:hypothetical protein
MFLLLCFVEAWLAYKKNLIVALIIPGISLIMTALPLGHSARNCNLKNKMQPSKPGGKYDE